MPIEYHTPRDHYDANCRTPAAPHDPWERAAVHARYGWEIRTYPWNSRLHRVASDNGTLHLQIWYPAVGLSILTPSRLTGGKYEVQMADERVRMCCAATMAEIVYDWAGVRLPCSRVVSFYYDRMVLLPYFGRTTASSSGEVS